MFLVRYKNLIGLSLALIAAVGFGAGITETMAADAAIVEQAPEPPFDNKRFDKEPPGRNWSLILGGGGIYEPEYEGSEDFKVSPVPFVIFTYGDWLEIDPRGVTINAFERNGFSVAGTVGYEMGRKADDHAMLSGLGDIDAAATLGGKLAYEIGPMEFYGTITQTLSGSESLIGTIGAAYSAPITEKLILEAGAEAVIANDKHMQAYFGVNAAQSAASGLAQYTPGSGVKRVDFSVSATYLVTENWMIRAGGGVGILTGDAVDSPIVKEKVQPSASLFVGYKF